MNASNGNDRCLVRQDERGMALLAVLMVVFLLTLLGMTSLQLAGQEMAGASALQEERLAHHAAEAAVDVVMGWFHDPSLTPQGTDLVWMAKRVTSLPGEPSYFDTCVRENDRGLRHFQHQRRFAIRRFDRYKQLCRL